MPKSHIDERNCPCILVLARKRMNGRPTLKAKELLAEFNGVLGTSWTPPAALQERIERLLHHFQGVELRGRPDRQCALVALVNSKFRFNSDGISTFLDRCAEESLFFNYHDKLRIQSFFNYSEAESLLAWAKASRLEGHLNLFESLFRPLSKQESLERLAAELAVTENRASILCSLFGGYAYNSFEERRLHEYFNDDCRLAYHEDIQDHLRQFYPAATTRKCALVVLVVDDTLARSASSVPALKDTLFTAIEGAFQRLSNYCHFAVLLHPLRGEADAGSLQWELLSDIVLFAEKFNEVHLKTGYFHPEKIKQATLDHVPGLDLKKAEFEKGNEGFYFKDCFVLSQDTSRSEESREPYDLLLLFEKNERDETLIPCPACRSKDVRGNSYPVQGVKSWECQNRLCPERSKYDRGNRYSLQSLLRQEAIEDPENRIPTSSLRRWKRDVITGASDAEVLEMLARHYTFHGDNILLVNWDKPLRQCAGRRILSETIDLSQTTLGRAAKFFDSAFFHRFLVTKPSALTKRRLQSLSENPLVQVHHGDAFEVLQTIPSRSVAGAVTSPPYYNAKSYASWPNIYCYLHDMFNIVREVHRVLEDGAAFLFNIFDYFDNENSIVFSAMGKKRMILGAYTVHLFRAAGFQVQGNIIWDKGEIEGKRNFNQGNHSPYYQAPFNCWEHIFVFSKGELKKERAYFPTILCLRPVFKMFNGENVLGHSAPYPKEIPELLLERLKPGSTVIDPFSGSMTTGRAALAKRFRSISIDCHREYCDLGLRLLEEETRQLNMLEALALAEKFSAIEVVSTRPVRKNVSYGKPSASSGAKRRLKAGRH